VARPRLLAALLLGVASQVLADEAPVLRGVEVRGATLYTREQVLHIVRLDAGSRLWSSAAKAADALAARYHADGYVAARVQGSLDPATDVLALEIEEGTLAEVLTPGLEGSAREQALGALNLELGHVLRERDVDRALRRLEKASGASLVAAEPPYEVEETPEGQARLILHLARRVFQPQLRLGRVGTQSLRDRVSGWSPRLGANLRIADFSSYEPTTLYGQAAYALDSHAVTFTVGAWRPFASGRVVAGYEFHDLTDTEDEFKSKGIDEPPGTSVAFRTFKDLFERRGQEAYALVRLSSRWRVGLTFRSDTDSSLAVVTGSPDNPPVPNPPIDAGRLRSLIAVTQWSSERGLLEDPVEAHRAALLRNLFGRPLPRPPRVALSGSLEWCSPDFGGDFSFRRLIVEGRSHYPLTRVGAFSSRLLVGVADGDVPVQKLFSLGGLGTLRGYSEKQFEGARLLLANAEWSILTGRLIPALIPFVDAGETWRGERTSDGPKADVGIGLRWPPTAKVFARVDGAVAVTRGGSGLRVTGLVQLPF
jgi:hypothetical protein